VRRCRLRHRTPLVHPTERHGPCGLHPVRNGLRYAVVGLGGPTHKSTGYRTQGSHADGFLVQIRASGRGPRARRRPRGGHRPAPRDAKRSPSLRAPRSPRALGNGPYWGHTLALGCPSAWQSVTRHPPAGALRPRRAACRRLRGCGESPAPPLPPASRPSSRRASPSAFLASERGRAVLARAA
jgi:hypothetical protein